MRSSEHLAAFAAEFKKEYRILTSSMQKQKPAVQDYRLSIPTRGRGDIHVTVQRTGKNTAERKAGIHYR